MCLGFIVDSVEIEKTEADSDATIEYPPDEKPSTGMLLVLLPAVFTKGSRVAVAVWCSSNALVLINAVALHRARLVLGWVTAFRQINYLTT